MDVAVESKLREAMKAGRPKPLTTKDLASAAQGGQAVDPRVVRHGAELRLYSNQGGIYDDVSRYLGL